MSNYLNFLDDQYLNTSVLFIVLGVIILIIGFCGCCGAMTENFCMMYTFATLLGLIVLVQVIENDLRSSAKINIWVFYQDRSCCYDLSLPR